MSTVQQKETSISNGECGSRVMCMHTLMLALALMLMLMLVHTLMLVLMLPMRCMCCSSHVMVHVRTRGADDVDSKEK